MDQAAFKWKRLIFRLGLMLQFKMLKTKLGNNQRVSLKVESPPSPRPPSPPYLTVQLLSRRHHHEITVP